MYQLDCLKSLSFWYIILIRFEYLDFFRIDTADYFVDQQILNSKRFQYPIAM